MKIIKKPEFEDDSYYFIIEKDDKIIKIEDKYMKAKRFCFENLHITKSFPMNQYFDRPSFTNVEQQMTIVGTIYTATAEYKNDLYYEDIIKVVKENKDISRRCVVTMADTLRNYLDNSVNTSCLNIIHYHKDSVKLFFRASDMTNELLYDINLIKEFFIDNVFESTPEIHVIASTAQNIKELNNLIVNE